MQIVKIVNVLLSDGLAINVMKVIIKLRRVFCIKIQYKYIIILAKKQ